MTTKWNPEQYERFKDERSRPFFELLDLVKKDRPLDRVVDLGCGTGELSAKLFRELKPKSMHGIDSSPEMLEKSKAFEAPGLHFSLRKIEHYEPGEKLDLLFSNAALQWVDHHAQLFPRLLGWVANHGQIAIQMPFNHDHPSHTIADAVARKLFPQKFAQAKKHAVLPIERYAEILYASGFREQVCRLEIYGNPMPSGRDVIEWTKGTLLTSYQAKLGEEEFDLFLNEYRQSLLAEIGEGPYFYAFKRGLIWGRKI